MNSKKLKGLISSGCLPVLFTALLFLSWPVRSSAQTEIIVYDGYTGIKSFSFVNDTARVVGLVPDSPAEKAGIRLRDQIISINGAMI